MSTLLSTFGLCQSPCREKVKLPKLTSTLIQKIDISLKLTANIYKILSILLLIFLLIKNLHKYFCQFLPISRSKLTDFFSYVIRLKILKRTSTLTTYNKDKLYHLLTWAHNSNVCDHLDNF